MHTESEAKRLNEKLNLLIDRVKESDYQAS